MLPVRYLHTCKAIQADSRHPKKKKTSVEALGESLGAPVDSVVSMLHAAHSLFTASKREDSNCHHVDPPQNEEGVDAKVVIALGKRQANDPERALERSKAHCDTLDFKGLLAAHYELVKAMPQLSMATHGPLYLCELTGGKDGKSGAAAVTVEDIGELIDREVIVGEESLLTVGTHSFICPKESSFVYCDIDHLHGLREAVKRRSGVQLITMDPPWENKSASRAARYETFYMKRLYQLPVGEMLTCSCSSGGSSTACDGAYVAIWCTHKEKYQRFITRDLFPRWSLVHCNTWYWAKVDEGGKWQGDLHSQHRKPFEPLYLGHLPCSRSSSTPETDDLVIFSTPSAQHSRKPPIASLLVQELFTPGSLPPQCLELFARNLVPGWLVAGNEPLAHQASTMFRPCY